MKGQETIIFQRGQKGETASDRKSNKRRDFSSHVKTRGRHEPSPHPEKEKRRGVVFRSHDGRLTRGPSVVLIQFPSSHPRRCCVCCSLSWLLSWCEIEGRCFWERREGKDREDETERTKREPKLSLFSFVSSHRTHPKHGKRRARRPLPLSSSSFGPRRRRKGQERRERRTLQC